MRKLEIKKRLNLSKSFFLLILPLMPAISGCEQKDKEENININNSSFIDQRDGSIYKTVKIGSQVWLAENLKYLPKINGSDISSQTIACFYVYDFDGTNTLDAMTTANYRSYGVLYNWQAAKEACPVGWHLPSKAEWKILIDNLGGEDIAGGHLKELGLKHWAAPNTGATNSFGFSALPGGAFGLGFNDIRLGGSWWSITEDNIETEFAYALGIEYDLGRAYLGCSEKGIGFSVRCIKD